MTGPAGVCTCARWASWVVPGKLAVFWRRPARALKSVDLPTLGLPTSATFWAAVRTAGTVTLTGLVGSVTGGMALVRQNVEGIGQVAAEGDAAASGVAVDVDDAGLAGLADAELAAGAEAHGGEVGGRVVLEVGSIEPAGLAPRELGEADTGWGLGCGLGGGHGRW